MKLTIIILTSLLFGCSSKQFTFNNCYCVETSINCETCKLIN